MIKTYLFSCLLFAVLAVGFSCDRKGNNTGTTDTSPDTGTSPDTSATTEPSADVKGTLTEVYVDASNQSDTKDGKNWDTAFADVNSAVDALAAEGGDIYVAVGTYNPEIILENKANIRFHGGFTKGDDTESSLLIRERSTFDGQNQEKTLVNISGKSKNISFDGFNFQGVKNKSAVMIGSSVVESVEFKPENVTINNCAFLNNENKTNAGGGLSIVNANNIGIYNSNFSKNKAKSAGGAIFAQESSITIGNTSFDENECDEEGGAIYLALEQNNDKATLTDLTFTKNTSKMANGGGAIFAVFDADSAQQQLVFAGSLTHSENKSLNNLGNFLAVSFGKEQDDDADLELEIALEQSNLAEFITVGSSGLKLENSADVYFPVAEPDGEEGDEA